MGTPKDSEQTRARIIEAAGRLFADKGFKGVTVRDIAKEADTHLSALNYHFRSKDALYREVVLEACQEASITPEEQEFLSNMKPEKALLVLVKEALKEYASIGSNNWQEVIVNRESWDPSEVFDEVVEKYFKPETDFVAGIVGKIVDQPPDSHNVQFAVISLFGLLETFGLYGHLSEALSPGITKFGKKGDFFAKQITHLTIEAAKPLGKR